MGIKNEIQKDEAQEFRKNNGIVMRNIITMFRRGWFKSKQLCESVDAYSLTREDVMDAIEYFSDRNYIETRYADTHEPVRPCDADNISDIEMRLCAGGVLVGKSLIDDVGIDL